MTARPEPDLRRELERANEATRLDSVSIKREQAATPQPQTPAPQLAQQVAQDLSSGSLSFPSADREETEQELERARAASVSRTRAPEPAAGKSSRRTIFFRRARLKPVRKTGGTVLDRLVDFIAKLLKSLEEKLTKKPEPKPKPLLKHPEDEKERAAAEAEVQMQAKQKAQKKKGFIRRKLRL